MSSNPSPSRSAIDSPSLPDNATPLKAGSSMRCSCQQMKRPSGVRAALGVSPTGVSASVAGVFANRPINRHGRALRQSANGFVVAFAGLTMTQALLD